MRHALKSTDCLAGFDFIKKVGMPVIRRIGRPADSSLGRHIFLAEGFTASCRRVLSHGGCAEMQTNVNDGEMHGERPAVTYDGESCSNEVLNLLTRSFSSCPLLSVDYMHKPPQSNLACK